jgi:hypothetical protein
MKAYALAGLLTLLAACTGTAPPPPAARDAAPVADPAMQDPLERAKALEAEVRAARRAQDEAIRDEGG